MAEKQANEALEKLNQGIEESRREFQQRTMKLAQDYFDDSVEGLKRQVRDDRAKLESLPDQVPGGREEAFQMLFQQLINNYSKIEECLGEAQENVANLDTEQIVRQGEVEASDAARREAQELGVDLTQVEGTGSGGRVIVDDVRAFAEKMETGTPQAVGTEGALNATDAARRSAERLSIDLSEVKGTGSGGAITVGDVTEYADEMGGQAGETAQGAQEVAGHAVQGARDTTGQAQETVGQVAGQAQETVGGATEKVQGTVGQVTGQAGQVAQQAQDAAGGAIQQAQTETPGESAEEPKATNAARRKAEELGVDLSEVKGTGSGGLITIKDVMEA